MANSIITRLGDGTTTQFSLDFTLGILRRSFITCRVGDEVDGLGQPVYRTLEWITDGLVNVQGDVPGNGVPVVFTRTMPKDALVHDYSNGAPIIEKNLDESNLQTIMSIHEFLDGRLAQLGSNLDLGNNKLINVAPGTNPTDGVNLVQVQDLIDDVVFSGSTGRVRISNADTTNNFLFDKIAVTGGVSKALLNAGGNEQIQLSVADTAITELEGDVIASGPGLATATIPDGTITNDHLAAMPETYFKVGGAGDVASDVSPAAATLLLPTFTNSDKGLVPAAPNPTDVLFGNGWGQTSGLVRVNAVYILASQTYTPSAGLVGAFVRICGGASEGRSGGSAFTPNAGGNSSFGSLLIANGATTSSLNTVGGTTSIGGGVTAIQINGRDGENILDDTTSTIAGIRYMPPGGSTPLGDGGPCVLYRGRSALAGISGTGYGSGATPPNLASATLMGVSGASGGYVEAYLTAAQIGASQSVTVGSGGAAGASGVAGRPGACIILEYLSQ